MTVPNTPPKVKDLPEATKDALLQFLRKHMGSLAQDVIETQLKERLPEAAERSWQGSQIAKMAGERYQELSKGSHPIGAIALAKLRAANGKGGSFEDNIEKILPAAVAKTLTLSDADSGGVLVQGEQLNFFYDVLRPRTVVLAANPEEVTLVSGSVPLTGFETDPSITWVGEPNTAATVSEPTTGARTLTQKTAQIQMPVSLDLINAPPGPDITRQLERAVQRQFAIGFDLEYLTGDGTAFTPKGLRNWAGTTTNTAGQTYANVLTDAEVAIQNMEAADVPMERVSIFMAPRSKNHLMFLLDGSGDEARFMDEVKGGTWLGFPLGISSQIPTNLSTNQSYVLFADMAEVVVGRGRTLELEYVRHASYTSGGALVSTTDRREQLLVASMQTDMVVPHTAAVQEIDQVVWGT